jgi:hypothetical protein
VTGTKVSTALQMHRNYRSPQKEMEIRIFVKCEVLTAVTEENCPLGLNVVQSDRNSTAFEGMCCLHLH